MNPEEKQLLEATYKLAEDNNTMLKGIRRSNRIASYTRIFYWIILIAITYASYVFLTPYMNQAVKVINQSQDSLNNLKNLGGSFMPKLK